jgi:hypothetical protein
VDKSPGRCSPGNSQDLKRVGKKCIFVANWRKNAYDRDGSIAKRGAQFLDSLKQTVPASVSMRSTYYDDEGHVPFPSTYDGLRWIYSCERPATKQGRNWSPPGYVSRCGTSLKLDSFEKIVKY